jgi:uncharacterized protein YjiS (DUF1127 family)
MAYVATSTVTTDHQSLIGRTFAALGAFFVEYAEVRSRQHAIEALNQLSDEELSERGLTREGIVRHVFSDKFYL